MRLGPADMAAPFTAITIDVAERDVMHLNVTIAELHAKFVVSRGDRATG